MKYWIEDENGNVVVDNDKVIQYAESHFMTEEAAADELVEKKENRFGVALYVRNEEV